MDNCATWLSNAVVQLPRATDQGVKRIRVQIEYLGQVLADQSAIRTDTDEK